MEEVSNEDFENVYEDSKSVEKPDGIDNVEEGVYKIAYTQWGNMQKELERCKEKLGHQFSYEVIGHDIVHQKHLVTNNPFDFSIGGKIQPFWFDGDDIPVVVVKIKANIENEKWDVIAIAEHVPSQRGIRITPLSNEEVPKEYYSYDKIECDHCHTNRDRTLGIIVKNKETKEVRMVGKTCIHEYTALSAADILALHKVETVIRHWDPMPGKDTKYFDVDHTLLTAYAVIKLYGYKGKTANRWGGYDSDNETTSEIVKAIMSNDIGSYALAAKALEYINEHAEELIKKLEEMKEFFEEMEPSNDYERSIKTALSGKIIDKKQIGIVVSAPLAYIRIENNKAVEDVTEVTPNNEFYGNVGDKVELTNIAKIIPGKQTAYGSYLITILTKDGYKFTAFVDDIPADLDKIKKVTGKISKHNEFRGNKSTTLSYASFIRDVDESNPDASASYVGAVGDKVHIDVASYTVGPEKSSSFGYNTTSYYADVEIKDKNGNIYHWACPNEAVYNKKVELKSLTATIKSQFTRADGVKVNKIGGRTKINESMELFMKTRLFESEDDADLMAKYYDALDEGIITDDMSFETFKDYGADNVIEFCKLAEQGAFDSTATIKDFIEYGAQNLNDLNVLKHKKMIFPSLTMSQCFDLGSNKAIEVSKDMFEKGCDEDMDVYEFLADNE